MGTALKKLEHQKNSFYKVEIADDGSLITSFEGDISLLLHTALFASADAIKISKGKVDKEYIKSLIDKYVEQCVGEQNES